MILFAVKMHFNWTWSNVERAIELILDFNHVINHGKYKTPLLGWLIREQEWKEVVPPTIPAPSLTADRGLFDPLMYAADS